MQIESVVGEALNEAALELSQYSYAVTKAEEMDFSIGEQLFENLPLFIRDTFVKGTDSIIKMGANEIICSEIVKEKINVGDEDIDNWLKRKGVVDGYDGLHFFLSDILGNEKDIDIIVVYKVQVEAFGLIDKTLTICQRAKTAAWLPCNVEFANIGEENKHGSIWQETNFIRGKYFVAQLKEMYLKQAVESGQGVDLFFEEENKLISIFSMNVFATSYSDKDFNPKKENIYLQLEKYVKDINADIKKLSGEVVMVDGSVRRISNPEKEILIVVPAEAETMETMNKTLFVISKELKNLYGVSIKYVYLEEALNEE
ncbi:MAG: hypothetical protein GX241_01825 [Ruminococcaceae bacterium]|nr:hypothetical protein [Oscillospiraceae bacterium]